MKYRENLNAQKQKRKMNHQKNIGIAAETENAYLKDFADMALPSTIKFMADYAIVGNYYACVWAIREYPPTTEEQAILSQLADKNNVTIRIYNRLVESAEQRKIIQNAARRNKMLTVGSNVEDTIKAEGNLQDVTELIINLRKNREPLLHCCVYIELRSKTLEQLKELQSDVMIELTRSKITVDRLLLRQKEGFLSVNPLGCNRFGSQFERVLPASSIANLFPLNYSGKTDSYGFYIGKDKFGSHVLVDFDKRTDDKTNSNVLILGNSGQGKSFLLKLLLTNSRESGKSVIALDAESEYEEITENLGGCYIDFMSGKYIINPLEPKAWAENESEMITSSLTAFNKATRKSQHIAYLKDFFKAYKDFTDTQIDTIEIMLEKLYDSFGITDDTDYTVLKPTDYPIMSDLFALVEDEYNRYCDSENNLYTKADLQAICLGLHSMCNGAESVYFNGYTNIVDDKFLCFGVKGLLDTNKRLKDTVLFNLLSYISNELLVKGNTAAAIDELYLFLSNLTAIEYIRNASKRVRKKDSAIILASQNVEDFLLKNIKEYTKPLFSIPSHHFLFNPGAINPKIFMDTLQIEESEFELIKYPERGTCLYRCGNERYLLQVKAPDYKSALFGKAGGR